MFRPLPLRLSLAALALLSIILGAWLRSESPAQPRVVVPPLPGDGALLLLPDGRAVLIDGSSDGAALSTWLGTTLPFGARRLDAVVLSRADATTLPGQLAALKRYGVGVALLPPLEHAGGSVEAWQLLLEAQKAEIRVEQPGDRLALGDCELRVLAVHAGHSALSLRCGAQHIYFLESVDDQLEQALAQPPLPPAAAVVYPWSRSTAGSLLALLRPQALVFGEAGTQAPQLTWADRQLPGARLLHEQIDGQIELGLDAAGLRLRTTQGD